MIYKDLVSKIAEQTGVSKKDVEKVVDSLGDSIVAAVKAEGRVRVPAIGVFELRTREARQGRNPQTGGKMTIKASRTLGFRPAAKVKDSV